MLDGRNCSSTLTCGSFWSKMNASPSCHRQRPCPRSHKECRVSNIAAFLACFQCESLRNVKRCPEDPKASLRNPARCVEHENSWRLQEYQATGVVLQQAAGYLFFFSRYMIYIYIGMHVCIHAYRFVHMQVHIRYTYTTIYIYTCNLCMIGTNLCAYTLPTEGSSRFCLVSLPRLFRYQTCGFL